MNAWFMKFMSKSPLLGSVAFLGVLTLNPKPLTEYLDIDIALGIILPVSWIQPWAIDYRIGIQGPRVNGVYWGCIDQILDLGSGFRVQVASDNS